MSASASEYRARRGAQYHVAIRANSTRLPTISTWKIIRVLTVPRNSLGNAEILLAEGMEPPSAQGLGLIVFGVFAGAHGRPRNASARAGSRPMWRNPAAIRVCP